MAVAANEEETVQQAGQQAGEPSVEDILRSIRKVVGGGEPPRASATQADSGPDQGGDGVLELTDVVEMLGDAGDFSGDGGEPLLASDRQAQVREGLAALAALAAPGAAAGIVRSAETSLEGLTRELLRPMMAQWLDRNLPPLVEKLLKAEIARLTGRAE